MHKAQLQKNDSFTKKANASSFLLKKIDIYLSDLQLTLNTLLDKRLVGTFYHLFVAILLNRNRSMGLLLSELGGFICGFNHAPAGTKRISNLLRSKKWTASFIDDFLFARSKKRIEQLLQMGKRPLLIWDDSKIEKSESWATEGLCSVESSKGKRLTKVKKGFLSFPCQPYLCARLSLDGEFTFCFKGSTQCLSNVVVDYPRKVQTRRFQYYL
jgi:hypothetical protein